MIERGAQVVVLSPQPVEPLLVLVPALRVRPFSDRLEIGGMSIENDRALG